MKKRPTNEIQIICRLVCTTFFQILYLFYILLAQWMHIFLKVTHFFWSDLWLLKLQNHLRSQVA